MKLDRKHFKTDENFERFEFMHPTAQAVAVDFVQFAIEAGVENPVITETVTTGKHDKALGRVSDSHETRRAFDARTWNMTTQQRFEVTDRLLKKWGHLGAISKDGQNRNLVVYHDAGHGQHLHIQLDRSHALPKLEGVS